MTLGKGWGCKAVSCEPDTVLRRLGPGDAEALCQFYNGLSEHSKRLFHPLGERAAESDCWRITEENLPAEDTRYDIVAWVGSRVVGWCFLRHDGRDRASATLGIAVSDSEQGKGLGWRLFEAAMAAARSRRLRLVRLTVVQDNEIARRMYEKRGFVTTGSFVAGDGLPYYSMERNPQT